jgi:hypothetical protein
MSEFIEGSVIIVSTGQSGTIIQKYDDLWVLLLNNDIWVGPSNMCRFPQDEEDLKNCPLEVERFEAREKINRAKED